MSGGKADKGHYSANEKEEAVDDQKDFPCIYENQPLPGLFCWDEVPEVVGKISLKACKLLTKVHTKGRYLIYTYMTMFCLAEMPNCTILTITRRVIRITRNYVAVLD